MTATARFGSRTRSRKGELLALRSDCSTNNKQLGRVFECEENKQKAISVMQKRNLKKKSHSVVVSETAFYLG